MQQTAPLVLGSGSPRRREILGQLGLEFRVLVSDVPEPEADGEAPLDYARRLAELKASAVAERLAGEGGREFVLGADTIVVIGERILGKPCDDADALAMLRLLSGSRHTVITAVHLCRVGGGFAETLDVSTVVEFRALDEAALNRYITSGEGRDKAGSYAIQDLGAGLVRAIEGSYSNVVGLPACETLELLARAGAIEGWP